MRGLATGAAWRRGGAVVVLALGLAWGGAAAVEGEAAAPEGRTPLAVVDGKTLFAEDVEGAVAYRIYRHRVDIHSLLRQETERRVDELLLEREAKRRGTDVEGMLEAVEADAEPATAEEVERYLAEHPAEAGAPPEEVRARVAHYLTQTRRLERRIAFLESLREAAGYRFLLEPPVPPRTEVDVEGAPARGPADAPITLVHLATFSSRTSARSAQNIARLREEFPGQIRQLHRNLLNDRDERGLVAARLAFAAQDAGAFWALHDAWFARDGKLDAATIEQLALDHGLPAPVVDSARTDASLLARVKHDLDAARAAGAPREPAIFVNGRFVSGIAPYSDLRDVIVEELASQPSRTSQAP